MVSGPPVAQAGRTSPCKACNHTRHERQRRTRPTSDLAEVTERVCRGGWHQPWVRGLGLLRVDQGLSQPDSRSRRGLFRQVLRTIQPRGRLAEFLRCPERPLCRQTGGLGPKTSAKSEPNWFTDEEKPASMRVIGRCAHAGPSSACGRRGRFWCRRSSGRALSGAAKEQGPHRGPCSCVMPNGWCAACR